MDTFEMTRKDISRSAEWAVRASSSAIWRRVTFFQRTLGNSAKNNSGTNRSGSPSSHEAASSESVSETNHFTATLASTVHRLTDRDPPERDRRCPSGGGRWCVDAAGG